MSRNIARDVCFILEKEKDFFTDKVTISMSEIKRKLDEKTDEKNDVKEITSIINDLEYKKLITILEKNKKKIVLKINEDLLNIDEDTLKENVTEVINIRLTPKRLLEYLIKISKNSKCTVRSKELVNMFECTYNTLMMVFKSLSDKGLINYDFIDGTFNIEILKENTSNNASIVVKEHLFEKRIMGFGVDNDFEVQLNEIFDGIGESIFNVIEYCKTLEAKNKEISDKLEYFEVALQRKNNECRYFENQVNQLKEKNDRLFRNMILNSGV